MTEDFSSFRLDPSNLPKELDIEVEAPAETALSAPTAAKSEVDNSIGNTLAELPVAVVNGIGKAGNEVLDLGEATINFVGDGMSEGFSEAEFREPEADDAALPRFTPYETTSSTAEFVAPVAQFLTSFVGVGKVMKGAKLLQGASRALRTGVQGAAADFVGFDAHEGNLSAFVESFPELRNPITRALAANEERSTLEGRLCNTIEGVLSGFVADAALKGISKAVSAGVMGVKRLRNAADPSEVPIILREIEAEVNEAISSKETFTFDDAAPASPTTPARSAKAPNHVYQSPYDDQTATFLKTVQEAESAEEAFQGFYNGRNFDHILFDGAQGSHVLKQAHDIVKDKLRRKQPVSGKEVAQSSMRHLEDFGIDYNETFEALKGKPGTVRALNEHLIDIDAKIIGLSEGIRHYGMEINRGSASELMKYRFDVMSRHLVDLEKQATDISTEVARTLALRKNNRSYASAIEHLQVKDTDEFLERWFTNGKAITESDAAKRNKESGITDEQRQHSARILDIAQGDKKIMMKLAKVHKREVTKWDVYKELYIEGLLSGWKTLAANPLSNALKAVMKPSSAWIGATLTGDAHSRRIAAGTLTGLMRHMGDSFSLANRAWKLDRPILDSSQRMMDSLPAAGYLANYESIKELCLKGTQRTELSTLEEWGAQVIGNFVGPGLHRVTKIMNYGDELFKQMYFRSNLEARLTEEALEKGIRADKLSDYIREGFEKGLDASGGAIDEGLSGLALKGARESTWSSPLEKGSISKSLQDFSRDFKVGTIAMPFVRTPTNLMMDLINHTPLATLRPDIWKAFMQGGEARAQVVGEMATGIMLLSTAGFLAKAGLITGSPPKNPAEAARWRATGKEPYSFHIGDTYISYRRFDPFAGLFNIAADMVNFESTLDDDAGWMDIGYEAMSNVVIATVLTVSSKTYYQGIMDVIEAVNEPEQNIKTKTSKIIGALLIPGSSAVRSIRQITDPYMREMDGPIDTLKNATPLSSRDLPEKRDWVTGQPIEYVTTYSVDKHDKVLTELAELGKGVMGQPPKMFRGVKLSTQEYSDFCGLHGSISIGGKTLSEMLEKLFDNEGYQQVPDAQSGYADARHNAVNRLIKMYRDKAAEQLVAENADLAQRITKEKILKHGSKAGIEAGKLRELANQ